MVQGSSTVTNAQVFTNFSHRGQYLLPTTAEYSCSEGFKLHGDKIIKCLSSGVWSLAPHCLPEQIQWLLLLLPILLILLTILILIAIYTHKMSTKERKQKEQNLIQLEMEQMDETLRPSPEKRKRVYDAIVFYNFDSEQNFVVDRLLSELEENRNFKLCFHCRDFRPGRRIEDNIKDAIEGSNSAIIIMSQGFVDSMWCREEFTHCYIENMKDPAFNLFVIMMQPADTLVNLSNDMKTFFDTKTYLQVHDPELFAKLATHLENARDSDNEGITGQEDARQI